MQLAGLSWRLRFSVKPCCTSFLDRVFLAVSHFGFIRIEAVVNTKSSNFRRSGFVVHAFGGFFLK